MKATSAPSKPLNTHELRTLLRQHMPGNEAVFARNGIKNSRSMNAPSVDVLRKVAREIGLDPGIPEGVKLRRGRSLASYVRETQPAQNAPGAAVAVPDASGAAAAFRAQIRAIVAEEVERLKPSIMAAAVNAMLELSQVGPPQEALPEVRR